ncbi:MAG: prolyl-tRNA synthetase associated domain-containing protein [Actinobacteria bacterium]|nr:prolyl-tRNA synthetase associated domain-containing protein [Actinomycetota bacterium]
MESRDELLALLDEQGIEYLRVDHPPVYTCEQARREAPDLPGAETKNLFVCDGRGRRHFLVVVRPDTRVDLRGLGTHLGAGGLRLASARRLATHLGLEPGSVTLLGVVNDRRGAVEVVIDEDLWSAPAVQCHPLVNTSTLVLSRDALRRFLALTAHEPTITAVPAAAPGAGRAATDENGGQAAGREESER